MNFQAIISVGTAKNMIQLPVQFFLSSYTNSFVQLSYPVNSPDDSPVDFRCFISDPRSFLDKSLSHPARFRSIAVACHCRVSFVVSWLRESWIAPGACQMALGEEFHSQTVAREVPRTGPRTGPQGGPPHRLPGRSPARAPRETAHGR